MKQRYMEEAFIEAERALLLKEVPVGAIIVKDNEIIARSHNLKETLQDVTAHAEILAIKKATEYLQNWRLAQCDMYVTLEPCVMCAGAIAQARIKNLYIGTFDPNMGACGSVMDVIGNQYLHHRVEVIWMYHEESSKILRQFFKKRRL